ncbi:(5-formylfuran-3-yl)methyl phosphate synthase [Methylogaea oryzae]
MLASVTNLEEARLALQGGADIIDLKNPVAGALGALQHDAVRRIVRELQGGKPISATVGDLPMEPQRLAQAVQAMGDTGVDYVKIGFFAGGDRQGCLDALRPLADERRLIAVLFADQQPDFAWIEAIAAAGFAGAMLDTANKGHGGLRQVMAPTRLAEFVDTTRSHRLLCGLAGSLRAEDIAHLLPLRPDYLGFRGALCEQRRRTASLDSEALARVRGQMENPSPAFAQGRATA